MPPRARRAAGRPQQAAPSLDVLPDDLLVTVMTMAGFGAVGALMLVSKRWQRVLVQESAAFSSFVLRPCPERLGGQQATAEQQGAWLEGQRSMLGRVAPRVHELTVQQGAIIQRQANKAAAKECHLHRQLGLLPGSLSGLALDYAGACSEALLAAAARAGGSTLTRLELNSSRLPASMARVLRALPTLRSLDLACNYPEEGGVLQAILSLTRFTRLALHSLREFYGQTLQVLGTLSALRQLSIAEFAHPPPYEEADVRALLHQASHLELFSYAMLHMTRDTAGFEIAGAVVDKLAYRLSGPNNSFVAAELGAVSLPSLQQALGALLPPDRQLQALTLVSSRVSPYAVQHCPRLEGLTELARNDVECEWGSFQVLLGELVDWAPGLARLHLQSTSSSHRFNDRLHTGQLPPEVEALQGLTALGISGHPVGYFPPGAYLSGLQELEMAARWRPDALARLQGSGLSSATALTSLTLSGPKPLFTRGFKYSRSQIRERPALERADVGNTLAHMRQLRRLVLQGWAVAPAVMRLLRRTLPDLAIEHEAPIEDSDADE